MRAAIFLLALSAYQYLLIPIIFRDSTDALGPGLLAFLGIVVASGTWALVDSHRAARTAPVLMTWLVVAITVGVLESLRFSLIGDGSPSEVVSELALFAPFYAILVMVPAACGAALGIIGRRPAAA